MAPSSVCCYGITVFVFVVFAVAVAVVESSQVKCLLHCRCAMLRF